MIAPLEWPELGDANGWRHLLVTVRGAAVDIATPTTRFEIWSAFPMIVVQESVEGSVIREIRANEGNSATLDLDRRLCLAETGLEREETYRRAVAMVVGPVASLYGSVELPGWRLETSDGGTAYHNDGPGPLRDATIGPSRLPVDANTVDGRWLWSIEELGSDPPPHPPDVREWSKESHERTEVPIEGLIEGRAVEHLHFRSSSLRAMDFIATGGDDPIHCVIERDPERTVDFTLPDGRGVTIVAGERAVAEPLVREVHQRLRREDLAPEVDEDAEAWNARISGLVDSIVPRLADAGAG